MNRQTQDRRLTAFTLVEILVVIAIVGIIAALLGGVFVRAKESAKATGCRANLLSLGKAALMYQADNGELLPPYVWHDLAFPDGALIKADIPAYKKALAQYGGIDEVFFCPSDPNKRKPVKGVFHTFEHTSYSLGIVFMALGKQGAMGGIAISLSWPEDPAATGFLTDLMIEKRGGKDQVFEGVYTCHGDNQGNVLYADGHVRYEHVSQRSE